LDDLLETTFYRVIQESLTNVMRHSNAQRASVVLERRNHQVIAIIEDNGCGFDVETTLAENTRLGLVGMRERLELVGGTLTIESELGAGTAVFARVPVAFEPEAATPQQSAI
jgi:signal transduction histidine kinase